VLAAKFEEAKAAFGVAEAAWLQSQEAANMARDRENELAEKAKKKSEGTTQSRVCGSQPDYLPRNASILVQ
jgi:hypothetical protein